MHHFFYKLYQWIKQHKLSAVLAMIIFLFGCIFTISKINFDEDITQMLPQQAMQNETAQIWKNVRFQDKIAVIISKKDSLSTIDDLIATAEAFLDTIPIAEKYIESIQGYTSDEVMQESMTFVYNHLPLYLKESDYDSISKRISTEGIALQMQKNYETLISSSGSFFQDGIVKDPLQFTFLALSHLQNISNDEHFVFQEGYLFTKDNQHLVLFIQPKFGGSETKENQHFVTQLENLQKALNKQYQRSDIQYFGSSFIAVANAQQIQKDIITTVSLSMTTLMIILMLYYRKIIIPILVFLPSLFGGITALAIMYFITDQLSAISISISAILLGITIDYALHFLTHSKSISEPQLLFKEITRPLFMSSFTTAIAFLCLLFVDAKALNDLGWFAFIAVMASAFFTLVILPHIYKTKQGFKTTNLIDQLAQYPFEKNKVLITVSLLLIIGSVFTFHKVSFDQDLTKINYFPEQQLKNQQLIEPQDQQTKSLYVVSYGENVDEVLKRSLIIQQDLENENNILGLNSISSIVLDKETQQERINRWEDFWKKHSLQKVANDIIAQSVRLGFVEDTYENFYTDWSKKYEVLDLEAYQRANAQLLNEYISEKDGLFQQTTIVKIPTDYRHTFFEKMKAYDQTVVIDRQALNEELLGHLVDDFNDLVNISFIAVLLILWYFFRRFEMVLLAAIPIGLTGWITAGIMGALDIPFNIFSSIVCTLIFGHGVDFTIFMTSALQKQFTYGKNEMPVYRTSIILAVLTTILAIGALIFAQHPALKSISTIALIGVCTAVLITFVLYPILFKIFIENRPKKGLSPVTLRIALESVVFFGIFGLGGIFISTLSRLFYWLAPISKERKYKIMGRIMSGFMSFILALKLGVRKKSYPSQNLSIHKQSVIISNHATFLDSLVVGKYTSSIIYLVNDWVFHSPFFGKFAQSAGFYPVSQGAETGVKQIEKRIGNDFSVVVFPEGTRSYTHEINRFKKGAFYLSESLHLPIQPLILHGVHEIIPKGDYMIYDGHINAIALTPILPDDRSYGNTYKERTKKISAHFKTQYQLWRNKLESADYYKDKLFLNYLYKEQNVVNEVKRDFNVNKEAYLALNQWISNKANIVHLTQDYGQTDFLLLKHSPLRKIQTVNTVEERRNVSETSHLLKVRTLSYHQDFSTVDVKKPAILLISHQTEIENISIFTEFEQVIFLLQTPIHTDNLKKIHSSQYINVYEPI